MNRKPNSIDPERVELLDTVAAMLLQSGYWAGRVDNRTVKVIVGDRWKMGPLRHEYELRLIRKG